MIDIVKYWNTCKYLKFIQIYYRVFYFIRKRIRSKLGIKYKLEKKSNSRNINFENFIFSYESFEDNKFIFLNLAKQFNAKIDWNFNEHRKLWTYNLNYFDFLNQRNILKEQGLDLINDFISKIDTSKDGLEPFPISLRGINWIKFLSRFDINNKKINDSLYAQYYILYENIEYHLLGNHLLENAFSLLFGSYYFRDEKLYNKAKKILVKELDEQILEDGGHFELSPMYHQIMLFRILDCINLVKNNDWKTNTLLDVLNKKAELMLGWLENISYQNGDIPLLNDSANKIAPSTKEIIEYAKQLSVISKQLSDRCILKESGYRKFVTDKYELIVDVGNIGPDYIPGHAHADTFNFELQINGKSFIVDTGLSTYEIGEQRDIERGTSAHNSVTISNSNSSNIWSAFRVAKRAKIIEIEEKQNYIKATHNGFKKNMVFFILGFLK